MVTERERERGMRERERDKPMRPVVAYHVGEKEKEKEGTNQSTLCIICTGAHKRGEKRAKCSKCWFKSSRGCSNNKQRNIIAPCGGVSGHDIACCYDPSSALCLKKEKGKLGAGTIFHSVLSV